jgi:hypothetical protein
MKKISDSFSKIILLGFLFLGFWYVFVVIPRDAKNEKNIANEMECERAAVRVYEQKKRTNEEYNESVKYLNGPAGFRYFSQNVEYVFNNKTQNCLLFFTESRASIPEEGYEGYGNHIIMNPITGVLYVDVTSDYDQTGIKRFTNGSHMVYGEWKDEVFSLEDYFALENRLKNNN